MAYRFDEDLEFLSKCSDEELNGVVDCLIYDKDDNARWTETLTASYDYKILSPEHSLYWENIAAEIQCFGANTFATALRGGKGVLYKEVLMDVCDKLKVNYNKKNSVERIEQNLLLKILEDALEKTTAEQLKEFATEVGLKNMKGFTSEALIMSF